MPTSREYYDVQGNPVDYQTSAPKALKIKSPIAGGPTDTPTIDTYDVNGNPINESDNASIDYGKAPGPMNAQLKPQRSMVSRAMDYFPQALSMGADYLTGGNALASGGAALVGEGIRQAPRILAGDTENVKEAMRSAVQEAALNAAITKAIPFVSKGGARLRDKLLQNVIAPDVGSAPGRIASKIGLGSIHYGNLEDVAALAKSDLPEYSVGQATHSPLTQGAERLFAPNAEKMAMERSRQGWIDDKIAQFKTRFGNPLGPDTGNTASDIGQVGQKTLLSREKQATQAVDSAYNRVKLDAAANRIEYEIPTNAEPPADVLGNGAAYMKWKNTTPQTRVVGVDGPIMHANTTGFINQIKPQIEQLIGELPDGNARSAFVKLNNQMSKLANGPSGGLNVSSWDSVKEFRTSVNEALKYKDHLTRAEGGLQALSDNLGKDIDLSIKTLWRKTPDAARHLEEANTLHSLKRETFNDKIMGAVKENRFDLSDPSKLFDEAKNNPDRAGDFIRALGPDQQRVIRASFFDDITKKVKGDPSAALDMLDQPAYRKVFSSGERQDLVDFFRTMRRTSPDNVKAGKTGLAWHAGGIMVGMGAEGLRSVTDSTHDFNLPEGALIGGTLLLGTRGFASKVLLNPRYARAASRLAKISPDANESKFLRKTIMTALRGTQAVYKLATGDEVSVSINKNGNIVPIGDQGQQ